MALFEKLNIRNLDLYNPFAIIFCEKYKRIVATRKRTINRDGMVMVCLGHDCRYALDCNNAWSRRICRVRQE